MAILYERENPINFPEENLKYPAYLLNICTKNTLSPLGLSVIVFARKNRGIGNKETDRAICNYFNHEMSAYDALLELSDQLKLLAEDIKKRGG